jgi:DNA-binding response OmpR family regulator
LTLPEAASSNRPRSKLRVLLVEDDPLAGTLAVKMLEHFGHEVVWVRDGTEAVSHALDPAIGLVLLDYYLPGLLGPEVAAAIRAAEVDAGGRRVTIIGLTASSDPVEHASCRDAGIDDMLQKPVTLAQLQGKLKEWDRRADEA